MNDIILHSLKTGLIEPGDSIAELVINTLNVEGLTLADNDVLVFAETPVAIAEGRLVALNTITPSAKAKSLAQTYSLEPCFAEVIIREADVILGGVSHALLCKKDGFLTENAGVDESNAPEGHVVLSPTQSFVEALRKSIESKCRVKIGVIITDSRTMPLRRGVTGVATIVSGMEALSDERGKSDLYGRKLKMTYRSIADDLAAAAQLLIGESSEMVPAVLIRGAEVELTKLKKHQVKMSADQCVYMSLFKSS